jgi:uncharacterized membrane protein HdeD (DUF308 family)
MSQPTPWKLAVTGGFGVLAAIALLSRDWTIRELAAVAGLALVARGALHLVTASLAGLAGALAVLAVVGDVGIGAAALLWPSPTLLSLVLLVGSWTVVRGIAGATIAVTTRADNSNWPIFFVFATVEVALAVALIARPTGSVRAAAVTIGLLLLVEGAREIAGAGSSIRRERRSHTTAPTQPAATAS